MPDPIRRTFADRQRTAPAPQEVMRGSRQWTGVQADRYYEAVGAQFVGHWPLGGEKRTTSAGLKLRTMIRGAVYSVELVPDGCVC